VLQAVLHPRPYLHQLVPVNQQLPQIALLPARYPQPGKPALDQQLQHVGRVPPVRLLLPHIAGPDLRRIPDPHLMPQFAQQIDQPVAVARGLQPDQRRRRQPPVILLRLPGGMHQLPFSRFAGLQVEPAHLFPARMKITAYNHHRRLLLPQRL
jgi:hypothetical protein